MSVPSNPQELINLVREKLFNNTSGLIEEPDLREVLEYIVKVLDAKFSFFAPNLTEEQFSKWNLILDYMVNETQGVLLPSSPAPTQKGKYLLSTPGTYANLGGLIAASGKLNYAYFDGTTWSLIATTMPQPTYNTETLSPTSIDKAETGKSVADYYNANFEPKMIEVFNEPTTLETSTNITYTEGATSSNYSSLVNTTYAHYNSLEKAPKDGKVIQVKVSVKKAGTITLIIGTHDYNLAQRFNKRATIGTFNVTTGTNIITLDFNVFKDEIIALNGGTAIIAYANYAYQVGNRFVQAYTNSDTLANLGSASTALLLQSTFQYQIGAEFKEELSLVFATKEEILNFADKITTTEVSVSTANGNNAVQNALNAITDNSATNKYIINVENGTYKISSATDFIGNTENNYPAMIVPKDYVEIKGKSKASTILMAELPYDDAILATQTALARDKFQTIWSWANESRISNITFIGKNLRYTLHQDNSQEANKTRYYDNCDFIFLGNKGFTRALGIGTYSGSKTYLSNGKASSPARSAFSIHNNINFAKPSLWQFDNFFFENLSGATTNAQMMLVQNSGSMQNCEIVMNNCNSNQFLITYESPWLYQVGANDCFNYANFRIKGSKNTPLFFNNTVLGKALMIKSNSTGLTSKVRFDTASTAYNSIIANPYNYWGALGHPERFIQDKYVAFDGAVGLNGYAIGGKSIIEGVATNGVSYQCSLGIRLGDCSTINKTLGIIVDGTTYNVVFNKNYSSMSNADIIAEINTTLGSVATASEYNIGSDYHAEFTDVLYECVNASATTFIPKGTLVTMKNNRISPCAETDELFGLAIDDIPPYRLDAEGVIYGKGRVIKNCYVTIEANKIQTAKNSGTGSKYKIINGEFVVDINGKYNLINSKYILIN